MSRLVIIEVETKAGVFAEEFYQQSDAQIVSLAKAARLVAEAGIHVQCVVFNDLSEPKYIELIDNDTAYKFVD